MHTAPAQATPLPSQALRGCSHGSRLGAAEGRVFGEVGFPRRSRVHRRSPFVVRGRLPELRRRARPHLPSATLPVQHHSPHLVGYQIFRHRSHNPRRQRLEPLVAPPLWLGHFGARLLRESVEGRRRGLRPAFRAHRVALLGLEEPLCGLRGVP
eukprot:scaffold36583_cov63-Phaeocystis_antarctica.AAC.5